MKAQLANALADQAQATRELLEQDGFLAAAELPDFLERAVRAYPERPGKALRPALVSWCCAQFCGDPSRARYAAACIELFHTWTLVHDDIIDGDETRRGGPTAHALVRDDLLARRQMLGERAARFGRDQAILAGDVQQAWANQLLLRSCRDGLRPELVLVLLDRLNGWINPHLIGGEALDVAFELADCDGLEGEDLLEMLRRKTAVLLRYAAETGAMIGLDCPDPREPQVQLLGEFAEKVGVAFQLQDDLLGLYGDPERLGKAVGADLRRGKRTLLVVEALKRLEGDAHQRLAAGLGNPDLEATEVAALGDLIEDCGAAGELREAAEVLVHDARACLSELQPSPWRELLAQWAEYAVHRDR